MAVKFVTRGLDPEALYEVWELRPRMTEIGFWNRNGHQPRQWLQVDWELTHPDVILKPGGIRQITEARSE